MTDGADSDQHSDVSLVQELARRDLMIEHVAWLHWHPWKEVAYFKRQHDEEWQPVSYQWSSGSGRAVVAPQQAKTRDGFTGYRHDAAELDVRRLDGEWFLQIRPTYLFTWDGEPSLGITRARCQRSRSSIAIAP